MWSPGWPALVCLSVAAHQPFLETISIIWQPRLSWPLRSDVFARSMNFPRGTCGPPSTACLKAVLVVDRQYGILYQNAAARRMSGLETGSTFVDVQRAIERRTPDGRLVELENGPVMRALR